MQSSKEKSQRFGLRDVRWYQKKKKEQDLKEGQNRHVNAT